MAVSNRLGHLIIKPCPDVSTCCRHCLNDCLLQIALISPETRTFRVPVTFQGTPGLTFGKAEDKMGWNAQPTCAVMMDNVRVPGVNLLGEEGKGFNIAMNACNVAYTLFRISRCTMLCMHSCRQLGFMKTSLLVFPHTISLHAVNGGRINIASCR